MFFLFMCRVSATLDDGAIISIGPTAAEAVVPSKRQWYTDRDVPVLGEAMGNKRQLQASMLG